MAKKILFQATPRTLMGRKVSQLRKTKQVPANVSGDVKSSLAIAIDQRKFTQLYDQVGDTGLFYLQVEAEQADRPVLISEVQRDPITDQVLHVVFRQVNLSEKITAEVPVEVINATEIKDAVLVVLHNEIEVEALPQDFPEKFEIDASTLTEIGQTISFKDLKFDKATVKLMIDEEQMDEPVVMIQEVKEEVEEAPVVEAAAEGDAAATPAEGAAETPAAPAEEAKKSE